MKLSDLKSAENHIKVLIYGLSGAGKTSCALGFPGPMYVADFDGKISSGANFWEAKDPKRLESIHFDNFQPTAANGGVRVYRKFEQKLVELEELAKQGKFPFKTFVLDSLTSFGDMALQAIMADNPGVKRVDPRTPAMQDYLILSANFKPMIYRLLALPCNVVTVGHLAAEKDSEGNLVGYRPALPGKLPELLPILFQEVYRAYVETIEGKPVHIAQTRPTNLYVARTQVSDMPPKVPLSFEAMDKYFTKKGAK
jgi:hypothetical protein